jgi:hypothetical protein
VNSEQLRKHALEVVGVIWLVIVAVQYVGRYIIGADLDFKFAYVGMLVTTVLAAILKRSDGAVG